MKSARCLVVLVVSLCLVVSCVAPTELMVVSPTPTLVPPTPTPIPPTPTPVPPTPTPVPPTPTLSPVVTPTPAGETTVVNLDEFFPPGPGQELVFENCGNCHNLGAILVVQFTENQWQTNQDSHAVRFTALTEEEFELIYDYLKTNFYPGKLTDIPEEFLSGWPAY